VLASARAWQMLALRDLATRVSTLEAAAAHEALGVRAAPQPARFHTVTAGPVSVELEPAAPKVSPAHRRLATAAIAASPPRALRYISMSRTPRVSPI